MMVDCLFVCLFVSRFCSIVSYPLGFCSIVSYPLSFCSIDSYLRQLDTLDSMSPIGTLIAIVAIFDEVSALTSTE